MHISENSLKDYINLDIGLYYARGKGEKKKHSMRQ